MTEDGRRSPAFRGETYPIGGHTVLPRRVCMPGTVECSAEPVEGERTLRRGNMRM